MSRKKQKRRPAKKPAHKTGYSPNHFFLLGLAAVLFLIGAVFLQNVRGGGDYPAEISVSEAAAKREAGAFILDVREPFEWDDYHIPGATLAPLGELPFYLDELPQDQEIVIVCRSGNRSQTARDILREAGFDRVTSMAGGLLEWRASGFPTERSE